MKFLLILQGGAGADLCRDEFEDTAREAGELVGGELLADPLLAITVPDRARATPIDDATPTDDATRIDAYYLIDVETPVRAVELAYLLPDTRAPGRSVEIRAVMHSTAVDI